MEREILFRGKSARSGAWIYGSLIRLGDRFAIAKLQENKGLAADTVGGLLMDLIMEGKIEWVRPSTIGQYAGLQDCSGRCIFEGDCLRPVKGGSSGAVIECVQRHGAWGYLKKGEFVAWGASAEYRFNPENCDPGIEIAGNKFDSPELLLPHKEKPQK